MHVFASMAYMFNYGMFIITLSFSTVTRLLDEDKYSNEALALEKLIMPLGTVGTEEKTIVSDNTPLKVPDNNPFRIRKNEERYQTKENVEKISVASSMEYTDLCMSPDNFQEEGSDGNLLKKRKFLNTLSDKVEATYEPVSVVTEAEKSYVCLTVESPESVTSEPKIIADLKGRSESKKKSNRRSNRKKTGSNNNRTLLHFFSRV